MEDLKVDAEAVIEQLSKRIAQLEVQLAVRTVQLQELKNRVEGVPKWMNNEPLQQESLESQSNA